MAEQLQGLLDKINQDGIAQAQAKSHQIIEDAKSKANDILAQAQLEAKQIVKNANVEADSLSKRAKSAIEQSSRDIILSLKSEIEKRLNNVLVAQSEKALTADMMSSLIKDLATAFIKSPNEKISVLVASKDMSELQDALKSSISNSFKNEVELFADKHLRGGFKVNFSGNDIYYDFSDEAIIALVSSYVTPKIAELLKK